MTVSSWTGKTLTLCDLILKYLKTVIALGRASLMKIPTHSLEERKMN